MGYYINATGSCLLDTNFNCKKWANGKCSICSSGYYIGLNNSCIQVNPLCSNFDYSTNTCTACYNGYMLYQNQCQITTSLPYEISKYALNCAKFNSLGQCVTCYKRFYLSAQICT